MRAASPTRRRFELGLAAAVTVLMSPVAIVMGGIPRLITGAYRDVRDLWRALAP